MKKLYAIAAVVLALIIAGCTPATTTSQTAQQSAQPTQTVETTPAGENTAQPTAVPYEERTEVRIGMLKGPTGIGAVKLMQDNADKLSANKYDFQLFGAPTDITPLLLKGELDIAALPTNAAATLFNKSSGKIKLAALNTLGVLYVLTSRDDITTLADLDGKKIWSSGQGSTPEYAVDYILKQNNLNTQVEFIADHSQLMATAVAGNADTVVLPEPFVTTLLQKSTAFKKVIDINAEWAKVSDALFSMGCVVVNAQFAQEHPLAVEAFLKEYEASANYTENTAEAASLVEKYQIMASAALAEEAIPNCNIVYIDGDEMKTKTKEFLSILYDYNPASIGGQLPGDDFYLD